MNKQKYSQNKPLDITNFKRKKVHRVINKIIQKLTSQLPSQFVISQTSSHISESVYIYIDNFDLQNYIRLFIRVSMHPPKNRHHDYDVYVDMPRENAINSTELFRIIQNKIINKG
jgi:hypothetical protein